MTDMILPTPLVAVEWLAAHLGHPDLVVLDAHMQPPSAPASTAPVVQIPGARRFDFDKKICAPDTDLPHMLPSPELFSREVQALGIQQRSLIVVYDRIGLFSAPRAWWMFRAMGHVVTTHMMDPKLHDFKNAKATGMADPQGDIAFDDEPLPMPQVVQRSRSTLETSLDN